MNKLENMQKKDIVKILLDAKIKSDRQLRKVIFNSWKYEDLCK